MRISVTVRETINPEDGRFESLNPAITFEDEVREGESIYDAQTRIYKTAEAMFVLSLSKMIMARDKRVASGDLRTYVSQKMAEVSKDAALGRLMKETK